MTDLSSLIERIEKSEGADRVVDGLIWSFLKGDDPYIIGNKPGPFPQKPIYGTRADVMRELPNADGADYIGAPPFSSSIDAAMTLIPEGAHCGMGYDSPREGETVGRAWAWVRCKVNGKWEDTPIDWRGHRPPSIALALCAAALKARNPSHEG